MKILVLGGFSEEFEPGCDEEKFARALGKTIVSKGHTLLNGCYNSFDTIVAEAAFEASEALEESDSHVVIQSYLAKGTKPAHQFGRIRKLRITSWDPGQEGWEIPEPIAEADAVVIVGGGPGTLRGAHLCALDKKPLLPVTAFGGASEEVFSSELKKFEKNYGGRVDRDQYTVLDEQFPKDLDALANSVLDLSSRLATGNSVFVIMAYRKELDDTFGTIQRVVKDYGYDCERMDRVADTDRIFPRMIENIRKAALVIAEISIPSVNVFYELGFAEALGKGPIVIARQGSDLPFDINDLPTTFYEDQTRLEEKLRVRVQGLSDRTPESGG